MSFVVVDELRFLATLGFLDELRFLDKVRFLDEPRFLGELRLLSLFPDARPAVRSAGSICNLYLAVTREDACRRRCRAARRSGRRAPGRGADAWVCSD